MRRFLKKASLTLAVTSYEARCDAEWKNQFIAFKSLGDGAPGIIWKDLPKQRKWQNKFAVKQDRLRLLPLDVLLQTSLTSTHRDIRKQTFLLYAHLREVCLAVIAYVMGLAKMNFRAPYLICSVWKSYAGSLAFLFLQLFLCCGSGCHNHFRNTPAPACGRSSLDGKIQF